MKDAHVSGKFNATPDEWDEAVAATKPAAVVGLTEALTAPRPIGWSRRGAYEADVLYALPWTLLRDGVSHIPTPRWRRGSRPMSSVEVRWVLLEHGTHGWSLLRASVHLPAHLIRADQRKAHTAAVEGLVPALLLLQRTTGANEVTLSMDANMDLRLARNRRRLERHGFRVVAPSTPTHGLRVIDGFLTTMTGTAETLPRRRGFDHRSIRATFHRKEH